MGRSCQHVKDNGEPCQAPPLRDQSYCFWHSPTTMDEAAEAQRLGGLRRRRERAVAGAYEFDGLESAESILRLLEIATLDTLSLENSVSRSRTLAYLVQTALRILEVRRDSLGRDYPEEPLARIAAAIESWNVPEPSDWENDDEED